MAWIKHESTTAVAPLVSVAVTTYNLEKWLPRALDNILAQRIDFSIEIVISDDASKDNTVQVAHSYRERYPDVIRVMERSQNVGIQRNTYEALDQCRGKYIAWCDADDYWTDPEKLAIQVKKMEEDPSISLCCHYVRLVTPDGTVTREKSPSLPPGRYGLDEIIRHNIISTLSAVLRNSPHKRLPDWYFDLASLSDWPLWVLAAQEGDIYLIDRVMANYMSTPGSSFLSKGPLFAYQVETKFYDHIDSILPSKWHRLAHVCRGRLYEDMSYFLRKQGEFTKARRAAWTAFCAPFPTDRLGSKTKTLLASLVREAQSLLKKTSV